MLLYKSSLTSLDYVLLLAACMYYTDKSESSAFMETFNVESINIIRRGRIYRYKKHVILQNMQSSKTYTIYAGMYKLL